MLNNNYNRKILWVLILLIFSTFLFSGCSRKNNTKGQTHTLKIAVVNKKGADDKIKPITVTVTLDKDIIVKNQVMKNDMPLSIGKNLEDGSHTIKITESKTGAVYKNHLLLDRDYWLRVVFYRESKGMGYFEGKLQTEPWGYEFEKSEVNDKDKEKDKTKTLKETKSREDDFDKKLQDLGKKKKEKKTKK